MSKQTLAVPESLTIYEVSALKESWFTKNILASDVELDLSVTSEIDGAGIQLVFMLRRFLERQQRILTLVNCPDEVLKQFTIVGLSELCTQEAVV